MALEIWRAVKIGLCATPAEYRAELAAKGMLLHEDADKLLDKIQCSPRAVTVNLVRVTPRQLGLYGPHDTPENYNKLHRELVYRDIYLRAQELGLSTCTAEVGPALRCQYPEQPAWERLKVGMPAIRDDEDYARVFGITADLMYKRLMHRRLTVEIGAPDFGIESADTQWLFLHP